MLQQHLTILMVQQTSLITERGGNLSAPEIVNGQLAGMGRAIFCSTRHSQDYPASKARGRRSSRGRMVGALSHTVTRACTHPIVYRVAHLQQTRLCYIPRPLSGPGLANVQTQKLDGAGWGRMGQVAGRTVRVRLTTYRCVVMVSNE